MRKFLILTILVLVFGCITQPHFEQEENETEIIKGLDIQLHEGGADLGELVYEDEEKWVNERFAEEIETAYGDVIEVGIPKSILQTDEIGLKFQVPAMCMTWGGIEIRI